MKHAKCNKLFKPISSINRIALLRFFLMIRFWSMIRFDLNMFVNRLMWIWVILRYFSCLYDELIYHLGSVSRALVFNNFITVYRGLRFENHIHALGIWSPRRSDRWCRTSSEKAAAAPTSDQTDEAWHATPANHHDFDTRRGTGGINNKNKIV